MLYLQYTWLLCYASGACLQSSWVYTDAHEDSVVFVESSWVKIVWDEEKEVLWIIAHATFYSEFALFSY